MKSKKIKKSLDYLQDQINDLDMDYSRLYKKYRNQKQMVKMILFFLSALIIFLIWNKEAFTY